MSTLTPDREWTNEYLAGMNAGSLGGNPYNFESQWRPVIEAIARRAVSLSDCGYTLLVQAERDIYLSSRRAILAAEGHTTADFDRYTVLACRPDVVIGFWQLVQDQNKKMVLEFVVAIIVELKKMPSRRLVNPRNGRPYSDAGARAILEQGQKAQRQGARQAALYLRTPAAKGQKYVWVVAVTGPDAAVSMMQSDHQLYRREADMELLAALSDEHRADDKNVFDKLFLPREHGGAGDNSRVEQDIPTADEWNGGLRWDGFMPTQSKKFREYVVSMLQRFRADHPHTQVGVSSADELHGLEMYA